MQETNFEDTTAEKQGMAGKFAQLPGGVQRVIIAVVLVVLLVGLMALLRMIKTEEGDDGLPEGLAEMDVETAVSAAE